MALTRRALKQTLGRLLAVASTGAESLGTAKVLNSVTGEGLDSVSAVVAPPTELLSQITGVSISMQPLVVSPFPSVAHGPAISTFSFLQ